MAIHHLKIRPEYFADVLIGVKKAELRKDDRGYEVGDILVLHEWDEDRCTGKACCVFVTHVLRNCPEYGLAEDYCILSIDRGGN